jgi:hypothetical protein
MADPIHSPAEPDPWTAERAPWIVVDRDGPASTDDGIFRCLRCGGEHVFEVPVDLYEWTRAGMEFVRVHKKCKAEAVAAEQGALV